MVKLNIFSFFIISFIVISFIALFYMVVGNATPHPIAVNVTDNNSAPIVVDITDNIEFSEQNIAEQAEAGKSLKQWWVVSGKPILDIELSKDNQKECVSHINKYTNELKAKPKSEYYERRLITWRLRCK